MPRIRTALTATTPTPRLSIESAMDRPIAGRPARTNTRGGIAPRFTQILIDQTLGDTSVVVTVTASIFDGSAWAEAPLNSALPAGYAFRQFWTEGPGDHTPPVISFPDAAQLSVLRFTVLPYHAGSWRLGWRYRATGIEGGMEILPFVVTVRPVV